MDNKGNDGYNSTQGHIKKMSLEHEEDHLMDVTLVGEIIMPLTTLRR